jgi:hypothetical protein
MLWWTPPRFRLLLFKCIFGYMLGYEVGHAVGQSKQGK